MENLLELSKLPERGGNRAAPSSDVIEMYTSKLKRTSKSLNDLSEDVENPYEDIQMSPSEDITAERAQRYMNQYENFIDDLYRENNADRTLSKTGPANWLFSDYSSAVQSVLPYYAPELESPGLKSEKARFDTLCTELKEENNAANQFVTRVGSSLVFFKYNEGDKRSKRYESLDLTPTENPQSQLDEARSKVAAADRQIELLNGQLSEKNEKIMELQEIINILGTSLHQTFETLNDITTIITNKANDQKTGIEQDHRLYERRYRDAMGKEDVDIKWKTYAPLGAIPEKLRVSNLLSERSDYGLQERLTNFEDRVRNVSGYVDNLMKDCNKVTEKIVEISVGKNRNISDFMRNLYNFLTGKWIESSGKPLGIWRDLASNFVRSKRDLDDILITKSQVPDLEKLQSIEEFEELSLSSVYSMLKDLNNALFSFLSDSVRESEQLANTFINETSKNLKDSISALYRNVENYEKEVEGKDIGIYPSDDDYSQLEILFNKQSDTSLFYYTTNVVAVLSQIIPKNELSLFGPIFKMTNSIVKTREILSNHARKNFINEEGSFAGVTFDILDSIGAEDMKTEIVTLKISETQLDPDQNYQKLKKPYRMPKSSELRPYPVELVVKNYTLLADTSLGTIDERYAFHFERLQYTSGELHKFALESQDGISRSESLVTDYKQKKETDIVYTSLKDKNETEKFVPKETDREDVRQANLISNGGRDMGQVYEGISGVIEYSRGVVENMNKLFLSLLVESVYDTKGIQELQQSLDLRENRILEQEQETLDALKKNIETINQFLLIPRWDATVRSLGTLQQGLEIVTSNTDAQDGFEALQLAGGAVINDTFEEGKMTSTKDAVDFYTGKLETAVRDITNIVNQAYRTTAESHRQASIVVDLMIVDLNNFSENEDFRAKINALKTKTRRDDFTTKQTLEILVDVARAAYDRSVISLKQKKITTEDAIEMRKNLRRTLKNSIADANQSLRRTEIPTASNLQSALNIVLLTPGEGLFNLLRTGEEMYRSIEKEEGESDEIDIIGAYLKQLSLSLSKLSGQTNETYSNIQAGMTRMLAAKQTLDSETYKKLSSEPDELKRTLAELGRSSYTAGSAFNAMSDLNTQVVDIVENLFNTTGLTYDKLLQGIIEQMQDIRTTLPLLISSLERQEKGLKDQGFRSGEYQEVSDTKGTLQRLSDRISGIRSVNRFKTLSSVIDLGKNGGGFSTVLFSRNFDNEIYNPVYETLDIFPDAFRSMSRYVDDSKPRALYNKATKDLEGYTEILGAKERELEERNETVQHVEKSIEILKRLPVYVFEGVADNLKRGNFSGDSLSTLELFDKVRTGELLNLPVIAPVVEKDVKFYLDMIFAFVAEKYMQPLSSVYLDALAAPVSSLHDDLPVLESIRTVLNESFKIIDGVFGKVEGVIADLSYVDAVKLSKEANDAAKSKIRNGALIDYPPETRPSQRERGFIRDPLDKRRWSTRYAVLNQEQSAIMDDVIQESTELTPENEEILESFFREGKSVADLSKLPRSEQRDFTASTRNLAQNLEDVVMKQSSTEGMSGKRPAEGGEGTALSKKQKEEEKGKEKSSEVTSSNIGNITKTVPELVVKKKEEEENDPDDFLGFL